MIRWALVLLFALTCSVQAQDGLVRPIARSELASEVRPSARPNVASAQRNDIPARRWVRAELGVWARPVGSLVIPQPRVPVMRPLARGTGEAAPLLRPVARPYLRPELASNAGTSQIFRAEIGMFAISLSATATSPRPNLRPASMVAAAEARRTARLRGQVCGDPAIQGTVMGRVNGAGACGISEAVRVRSVAGVTLSPRPTIDCRTATALKRWVERGVIPAVGNEGGGAASLRVVSHYACRTRNNQPGARLSEHSFGRAIDIAGIRLKSGREITLLTDWRKDGDGARLRQMWRAACGLFGTVLGPEANRFHRDHFHFDTARYRSGSYCR